MLSYPALIFCLAALTLAVVAFRLDRRGPANRAVALAGLLYAIWSFCSIFIYAANDPTVVMAFYRLSFIGGFFLTPSLVWLWLVLARTTLRLRILVIAPLAIFTLIGYVGSLYTNFRYVTFTPGSFGNIGVPAEHDFWTSAIFYVDGVVEILGVTALLVVSSRERSQRVRRMHAIVVTSLLVSMVFILVSLHVQASFAVPPLPVIACAPGFLVNFFLISRFRYLRSHDPMVASGVGKAITQSVLTVDENRRILALNAAAERDFSKHDPVSLAGTDFANLFDNPDMVVREWDLALSRRPLHPVVPCQMNGLSVLLHLTPHYDRFHELSGAIVVLERLAQLDQSAARYNISPREKEIIALLRNGYRNQEIADYLFVTVGTVKNHIVHIFQKTGVSNRVELSSLFTEPEPD